jgi:hypothetical protein
VDSIRADSIARASARRTFSGGVAEELGLLQNLFRSRDRRRIASVFGDDEADRILQKLGGNAQLNPTTQVTGSNESAGTVDFFLTIRDQAGTSLHSGFYTARFTQFSTGWKLLTVRPRR